MQSFLMFFYILDQCYDECQENDLGGLLGSISPELWEDGRPMDKSVYNDWKDRNDIEFLNSHNIVNAADCFLEYYQTKFGFDFSKTIRLLRNTVNNGMIAKAIDKTNLMYQKHNYSD